MSTLSEKERHGLEDVFLSISTTRTPVLKYRLSHYQAYLMLHLKVRLKGFKIPIPLRQKLKNTLKNTIFQKNSLKT
jgi:hypothetical protein